MPKRMRKPNNPFFLYQKKFTFTIEDPGRLPEAELKDIFEKELDDAYKKAEEAGTSIFIFLFSNIIFNRSPKIHHAYQRRRLGHSHPYTCY
jgi:hypothetical protein